MLSWREVRALVKGCAEHGGANAPAEAPTRRVRPLRRATARVKYSVPTEDTLQF